MDGACGTMGEKRGAHRILEGKTEGKDHLEDQPADGRIILDRMNIK